MGRDGSTDESRAALLDEIEQLRAELDEARAREASPERLHAQRAQLILDGMDQFVGLVDAEGCLVDANRTAFDKGGIDPADVLGKPMWETPWFRVSPDVARQCHRQVLEALKGHYVRGEIAIYGAEAGRETIYTDFSLSPLRDAEGRLWIVAEGRDITARKRAESEAEKNAEELREAHERLKELDALKSQFFANISHELRTPLSLVLGPVRKLLGSADLEEAARRDLETVERNASLLRHQVDNFLDLAMLESKSLSLRYVRADLAELTRLVVSYFEAWAAEEDIACEVAVPPALPAELDPDKIQRVLLNLLSNAFKFTPQGGRVRCSLEATEEGEGLVAVQDTGPGVPEAWRGAIFDRFRRVGTGGARRRPGGSGLGLSVAAELCELHGGFIHAGESDLGGARFELRLPLRAPEGVDVAREAEPLAPERDAERFEDIRALSREDAGASETAAFAEEELPQVLVVEDHAEMRRFIGEALAPRCRVATAQNGREGLDQARRLHPELIVTDVMMPEMGGDELIEALRLDPDLDDVPIVVLTAKADEAQRIELLEAGVQDHLVKPFRAEELLARVSGLLRRRRETVRALRTMNSRLETALEGMRVARDHAERASRLKSDFLRLVSHELRAPLTPLKLQVERMRLSAEGLPRELRELVPRVVAHVERLDELIERLLHYARSQSGQLAKDAQRFDTGALLSTCLDEVRVQGEEKDLALHLDVAAGETFVSDPQLVRVIVVNLLGNAIRFTPRGAVTLRARRTQGHLEVAVEDTGPGIPPEERTRIFEPFEQLETLQRKHAPGVGLGLALVHEMTEALSGRIEVDSEPGHGSTFRVRLPPLDGTEDFARSAQEVGDG